MSSFLQDRITYLLAQSGLDEASFKVLLCTLLSFPFSLIFKRLPDTKYTLKNLFVVLVSMFYIFGILDLRSGFCTLMISSLGCYFITRYLRTSLMPWINFLFLMSHLAYNHLTSQFFQAQDLTVLDITGAQMVLVMKLSAFGWNVYDGIVGDLPSDYTKLRMVTKHPNILPFLGYVFFYPALLTGPAFDFVDYDKFIHSTLFDDVPEEKRPGRRWKRRIPKSGKQALLKVLQGAFFAGLFVILPPYVNLSTVLSSSFVSDNSFIFRIYYLWILGFVHRLKYYTVWLIAEGACILCGIGYNGYDSATNTFKWNRVQNIDPWKFETGQNVHACLEAWNMNTNKWLKHYVYSRIAKKGKRPGFKSTLFTFVTSAFWHGTRPGYYLMFMLGAMMQTAGKIYRRNLRPIFMEGDGITPKSRKKLYDFVCWNITQLGFGFVSQPFVILDFKKSLQCWASVYFYVVFGVGITLFLFRGPFKKQVVAYCRSFTSHELVPLQKDGFNQEEEAAIQSAIDKAFSRESSYSTLGVPSLDVLEETTPEEFQEELKDISETWHSFRARRGSFSNDFEGLKDAYNNFASELNEIVQCKKIELSSHAPNKKSQ